MKTTLIHAAAATLMAALISTPVFAGATIDKGALGSYERHGRFVRPVLSAASPKQEHKAMPLRTPAPIDKGELGSYVRSGRMVKPVMTVGQRDWPVNGLYPPEQHRYIHHGKRAYRVQG
ncbi:MAG: hypothetical protein HYV27_07810 [Candidatus Hydrogenedentes bacterium]|nr:hypothetical protein [Candidatus Hydrogenedentota bacterium]